MRVMITGASGMLARDVVGTAQGEGWEVVALARAELDITDRAAVDAAVADARPQVVFNCAAYTDVDGAERERKVAEAVNGAGAGNVAAACHTRGVWLIHISSDYVFDGTKRTPYVESDAPAALSAYGASKLSGERRVALAAPGGHTIVRSSWLFGTGGRCFPATILRLARERGELSVVDDQVGCPTFTPHLAQALLTLATDPVPGVLHVAGAGACSWYELAKEVITRAEVACEIRPTVTARMPRPAPRPAYSVLGTERGAPPLPGWREGIAAYVAAGAPAR